MFWAVVENCLVLELCVLNHVKEFYQGKAVLIRIVSISKSLEILYQINYMEIKMPQLVVELEQWDLLVAEELPVTSIKTVDHQVLEDYHPLVQKDHLAQEGRNCKLIRIQLQVNSVVWLIMLGLINMEIWEVQEVVLVVGQEVEQAMVWAVVWEELEVWVVGELVVTHIIVIIKKIVKVHKEASDHQEAE